MSIKKEKSKQPLMNMLLRLFISSALIIWLTFKINWSQFGKILAESSLLYIFFAIIAIQVTVLASVWKWKLLVNASVSQEEKQNISFGKLGKLYYIGLFFNNFLPSSVGGDVVRIYQLGKMIGMAPSATSVGFERFTSGIALIFILIISTLYHESVRPFLGIILILTIIFLGLIFIITFLIKLNYKKSENQHDKKITLNWIHKISNTIAKIGATIRNYRQQPLKWWISVAILSFMFQIGLVWINDLLFMALHVNLPWIELLVMITLISALTMLPISINGLGVREVSYVYFFQSFGVSEEISISVSLLFFILVSISSLIGGLFWLSERRG